MQHLKQQGNRSCVNACLAMLLNTSEGEVTRQWKLPVTGISFYKAVEVLRKSVSVKTIHVHNVWDSVLTHLKLLSGEYPLYISATFEHKGKVGRPQKRRHAFVVHKGQVYDPSESNAYDIDCHLHTFNHRLTIESIALIGWKE